jgi:predicted DNA-binding antitoxin AbrB/MazE fold protein
MSQVIDAVYEGGVFRPLNPQRIYVEEGNRVKLLMEPIIASDESLPEVLLLARRVYEGLADEQIDAIEAVAFDRSNWGQRRDVSL